MPNRARRSTSARKHQVVTPGGRTVTRYDLRKPKGAHCGCCGCMLNRARLSLVEIRRLSKVGRRPERPLPELCPACMRCWFKAKTQGTELTNYTELRKLASR